MACIGVQTGRVPDGLVAEGVRHVIPDFTATRLDLPSGQPQLRLAGGPEDAQFLMPDGVREHFAAGIGRRGAEARHRWTELFAAYRAECPELAAEIDQMQRRELPVGWDCNLPVFPADAKGLAGRDASGKLAWDRPQTERRPPWFLIHHFGSRSAFAS
jgi:transketolase